MKAKIITLLILAGVLFISCNDNKKPAVPINEPQATAQTESTAPEDSTSIQANPQATTSTSWVGTYKGLMPCPDCPGIQTEIILKSDSSFVKNTEAVQKKNSKKTVTGKIQFSKNGTVMSFDGLQYEIGNNQIYQLDSKGKKYTGARANNYIIPKVKK